ncbi:MAG TPA: divalent metal cation transporter [Actinomycetota bacterium]|nr:divalent metal cation transporter [Actinomycetota bacterium]
MKKFFEIFLGILTAFGGFVDIGDLVANAETGARFGMALAWVVVIGVIGIVLYAEMSGRVAAMSGRPVFDVIRERLGARIALIDLVASLLINVLTVAAEIGGLALVIQLATALNYLLWVPLAAAAVWIVIWKVRFSVMEKVFGITGLLLVVTAVALWRLDPDWGRLLSDAASVGPPATESWATYLFFAVALLGAAMTPYEVFFFSSGAVEEHWTRRDLMVNRANVYLGFPLGGLLSLAIMAGAAVVLEPRGIDADHLSQMALPVALGLGRIGLAILYVGMFAAIFSAALETSLSAGYTVAQFFGWQWGKYVRPREASRFHVVVLLSIVVAVGLVLTTIDPIKLTEYSIVLSAAALPLTYFPILVVANDPSYVGESTNSRLTNAVGFVYLVLLLVVSIATIPLMIWTRAGA